MLSFATPREGSAAPYRFLFHAQRAGGSGAHVLVQVGGCGSTGMSQEPLRAGVLARRRGWGQRMLVAPSARPDRVCWALTLDRRGCAAAYAGNREQGPGARRGGGGQVGRRRGGRLCAGGAAQLPAVLLDGKA